MDMAMGGGCLAVGGGLWVMKVVGMVGIWPWALVCEFWPWVLVLAVCLVIVGCGWVVGFV